MRWRVHVSTAPLVAVLAAACATPETVREARDGRYPELLAELNAEVHSFRMSNREAYLVAHAVATRNRRRGQGGRAGSRA